MSLMKENCFQYIKISQILLHSFPSAPESFKYQDSEVPCEMQHFCHLLKIVSLQIFLLRNMFNSSALTWALGRKQKEPRIPKICVQWAHVQVDYLFWVRKITQFFTCGFFFFFYHHLTITFTTLLTQNVWRFSSTRWFSATPAGCLTI